MQFKGLAAVESSASVKAAIALKTRKVIVRVGINVVFVQNNSLAIYKNVRKTTSPYE